MKRSLLGSSEATLFDKTCALIGGFAFAPAVIYFSVMMISDLPVRSELISLKSSEVVGVQYGTPSGSQSSVRLYDRHGLRLTFCPKEDGFRQLAHAIHTGQPYTIYYNRERRLFSNSPKLYNIVYEIRVKGNVVKSYDERVERIWTVFGSIGVFGLLWLAGAILVLRKPTAASPTSPTME